MSFSFLSDCERVSLEESFLSFFTCKNSKILLGLLPFYLSPQNQKKALLLQEKHPDLVWISSKKNLPFYSKKFLNRFQPLYFIQKEKEGNRLLCDLRYLTTPTGLKRLPLVKVPFPLEIILKTKDLAEEEAKTLHPSRPFAFYLKGDSTDRFLYEPYRKSLSLLQKKRRRTSLFSFKRFYAYLKNLIDK
jgi:hypothetical protein